MPGETFRCHLIRSRMGRMPPTSTNTPERGPTVEQLLAFYLEAGVDCALTDEAVDRLSDLDPSEGLGQPAAPPRASGAAAVSAALRGEAAPQGQAGIHSAREAARTAPTLEALRALLESF